MAGTSAPALLDMLADEMFAALQEAPEQPSSSDDEEQTSEEGHAVGQVASQAALAWRPRVELGGKAQPSPSEPREPSTSKRRDLAKQLRVPPADGRMRGARQQAPETAGRAWYDLPATTITDEVKRDLRTLQLRTAFDPKTFYKKPDKTKFPKYFQFGTVIEGPTEFYSARLPKAQRRASLTEQILADPDVRQARQRRYAKLQAERAPRGKGGRKTSNPRLKKKPKKPKH